MWQFLFKKTFVFFVENITNIPPFPPLTPSTSHLPPFYCHLGLFLILDCHKYHDCKYCFSHDVFHILTYSLGFMTRNVLPISILPTDNATNKLKIHFSSLISSSWFAYYANLQKVIRLPFDLHFFHYCDEYFSLLLTRASYSSSFISFFIWTIIIASWLIILELVFSPPQNTVTL